MRGCVAAGGPYAARGGWRACLGSGDDHTAGRTTQVTLQGTRLYTFVKDKDDGDTYGQGVNRVRRGLVRAEAVGKQDRRFLTAAPAQASGAYRWGVGRSRGGRREDRLSSGAAPARRLPDRR